MGPRRESNSAMAIGDRPSKGRAARPRPDRPEAAAPEALSSAQPVLRAQLVRGDFPVVALGASAGGLETFRNLFDVLPADSGMAFILIQHLDPTHASMMVDLLADHTKMQIRQATDGMPLERDHVYVIPPA